MDLNKDLTRILGFSLLDWFKDKEMLKYLVVLIVIYVVFSFGMLVMAVNSFSGISNNMTNPMEIIPILLGFYAMMGLILIPFIIVAVVASYLIIARGLKLSKKTSTRINLTRFVKYIILEIMSGLVATLSLFNVKYLLIGFVGFILTILGFIMLPLGISAIALAGALIGIGVLLLIAYCVIVVYNSIRLSVGEVIFVEGEKSIMKSLEKSWKITKGNVLNIFIAELVLAVILMIINFVVTIPAMAYSMIISIASVMGGQVSNMTGLGIMADPIYIMLLVPSFIVSAYFIVAGNLFIVGIYNSLKKN